MESLLLLLPTTPAGVVASVALGVVAVPFVVGKLLEGKSRRLNPPPAVPGLPLIGDLHQLKEKKPHKTFANWAEIYGPIYTIKTGASNLAVLNSTDVAKEKQHRAHRDTMINKIIETLHSVIRDDPHTAVNFREAFKNELFRLSLKEATGKDADSIYVEKLGKEFSKKEMFEVMVVDPMMGAIDVDWKEFFPHLRWIPNKSLEMKIQRIVSNSQDGNDQGIDYVTEEPYSSWRGNKLLSGPSAVGEHADRGTTDYTDLGSNN